MWGEAPETGPETIPAFVLRLSDSRGQGFPEPKIPSLCSRSNRNCWPVSQQALDQLSPGAGDKAAFESPKVAAHGDYAVTAAMQLAKPLKANPRQLGEQLKAALMALPVYQQWVADIEIAGPGFLNLRLKPAAKQAIVTEVLQAGEAFGVQPSNGQRLMVEFVSANPTGPLHVGHGRQAALGDAICNLYSDPGLGRVPRVLLQRRGRADRDAGHQHAAAHQGLQAR